MNESDRYNPGMPASARQAGLWDMACFLTAPATFGGGDKRVARRHIYLVAEGHLHPSCSVTGYSVYATASLRRYKGVTGTKGSGLSPGTKGSGLSLSYFNFGCVLSFVLSVASASP